MNFHDRFRLSEEFANQCRQFFAAQRCDCRDWGEHDALSGIPLAARMKMPKEIRYQPDFMVSGTVSMCGSGIFGVDAKSGSERRYCTIEKNAYVTYMNIDAAIPIFILTDRSVHDRKRWVSYCRVSKLKFIDSQEVVYAFRFAGCEPYPIDTDGWIVPPRSSSGASDTPYKAVDWRCLVDICGEDEWKRLYSTPQKALF
jgi:hypothetical protein